MLMLTLIASIDRRLTLLLLALVLMLKASIDSVDAISIDTNNSVNTISIDANATESIRLIDAISIDANSVNCLVDAVSIDTNSVDAIVSVNANSINWCRLMLLIASIDTD